MKKVLVSALVLWGGIWALAQTADEILTRVEERGFFGTGRESFYAVLSVEIQEKGQPRVDYAFRVWAKEYPDATVKFLLLYVAPEDVAGTIFLAHMPATGDTRMWLYLPELELVKELVGEMERRGEFLGGSGITYEDISKGFSYREDYKSELLGEEELGTHPTWKLGLSPRSPDEDWGWIALWVHRDHYLVVRAEFYDKEGRVSRILTVPEITADEVGPRPASLRVEDLEEGSWAVIWVLARSAEVVADEYFLPVNLPTLKF